MSAASSTTQESTARFAAPVSFYFIIFAVSGFSGLIYESIWSHYLKLFLGHAAYAQSLVLITFMGGMALGSWLASRFSERRKSLLLIYALIEMIIGVAALVFHGLFTSLMDVFYSSILPSIGSPAAGTTLKWLAASLLIMPQSVLLGMTFPLMSAGIIRRYPGSPGGSIAMLYFANSIGAAIGVLASGFWLIKTVGLPGTIFSAGLINILLASTVWMLARFDERGETRSISRDMSDAHNAPLTSLFLIAAFVTGAASFIYEIGWIRMLSLVLGSTTHSFELMLSAFITGLALGGLWIKKRIDGIATPIRFSGLVQVVMGLFALATIPVYIASFDGMAWLMGALEDDVSGYTKFTIASHAIALAVMLPTTFVAGMTLPLFTFVLIKRGGGEASIGRVYAANTVGAIVGVLFAVHVGLPQLGVKNVIVFGAMLDIVLGLVLLSRISSDRMHGLRFGAFAALLAIPFALGIVNLDPKLLASGVYRFGNTDAMSTADMLYYEDGKTASIALSSHDNGAFIISTNGKPDAAIQTERNNAYAADEITMTLLGALPMAYKPDATHVANMGIGSGMTTHVLLAKDDIYRVDTIEIEPKMVEASRGFGEFVARTHEDPRSHIFIEDAKTFFSLHNSTYDAIIAEPSNPWVSGVASLFSTEFYEIVARHLEHDGVFVQWIQLYEFNDELAASILKALSENFSDYVIYAADSGNILLIARKQGRMGEPDWPALFDSGLARELEKIEIRSKADIQVRRILDAASLNAFLRTFPAPINSDYYPFVDLNAAEARFAGLSAKSFTSWLQAPLPVLETLGKVPIDFDRVTRTTYLNRLTRIAIADRIYDRIVKGAGEQADVPEDVRSLSAWLVGAAAHCENVLDLDKWLAHVQDLMVTSLPYMKPQHGAALIDAVSGSDCEEQQLPLIVSWFDLYRSVAARDSAAMASTANVLMEGMPSATPARYRIYALDALMLGEIAMGQPSAAQAAWQRYGPELYGDGPLPGHLHLLVAMAFDEQSID